MLLWQQGETASQMLASRCTNSDEAQLMEHLLQLQAEVAIDYGHLAGLRHLFEGGGLCVDQVVCLHTCLRSMLWSLISLSTQEGINMLLLQAARRGDLSIFEYLVEHGSHK